MDATIRLDHLHEDDPKTLTTFLDHYQRVLVYDEIASQTEKQHYQGFITFIDEKAYNAAKVRFSTMFKNHTKGLKSMAKVKKESYKSYICKDGKQFFRKGITDEELQTLVEASYKKSDKKDAKNVQTPFRKAFDYCQKRGITSSTDGWQIVEFLIDYYREEVKCEPNDFQLKNMAKSIATHAVYTYAQGQDRMDIYQRYLRTRSKQIIGQDWHDLREFLTTTDKKTYNEIKSQHNL